MLVNENKNKTMIVNSIKISANFGNFSAVFWNFLEFAYLSVLSDSVLIKNVLTGFLLF